MTTYNTALDVARHGGTEAAAVRDLTYLAQEPTSLDKGEHYAVIVPEGAQVARFTTDALLDGPRRATGVVRLLDATSFAAYVVKHAEGASTELYADPAGPTVTAVLNGHGPADDDVTGWGDHRADLVFRHTTAWQRWAARDGRLGGQVEFAEHIEASLPDVVNPDGAQMLELAQSFQANSRVAFEAANDLASGQRQLVYRETVEAKAGEQGQITIPRTFELGLQPYEGGSRYAVTARLRYRIGNGRLEIGYVLDRPEDVLRTAFDEVLTAVQDQTERVALLGTPAPPATA